MSNPQINIDELRLVPHDEAQQRLSCSLVGLRKLERLGALNRVNSQHSIHPLFGYLEMKRLVEIKDALNS